MKYEEYKKQMDKAAAAGENIAVILDTHINAVYMPDGFAAMAKRYKKELEINTFLIDTYADKLVCFDSELTYEKNLFAHEVDTPHGKIIRLQTSPGSKGAKGVTFWNWKGVTK